MPSDAVLRRKAQKKKKRKDSGTCEHCGGYTETSLQIWPGQQEKPGVVFKQCRGCKRLTEMPWTGVPG